MDTNNDNKFFLFQNAATCFDFIWLITLAKILFKIMQNFLEITAAECNVQCFARGLDLNIQELIGISKDNFLLKFGI
jgi:hypothetical protein